MYYFPAVFVVQARPVSPVCSTHRHHLGVLLCSPHHCSLWEVICQKKHCTSVNIKAVGVWEERWEGWTTSIYIFLRAIKNHHSHGSRMESIVRSVLQESICSCWCGWLFSLVMGGWCTVGPETFTEWHKLHDPSPTMSDWTKIFYKQSSLTTCFWFTSSRRELNWNQAQIF